MPPSPSRVRPRRSRDPLESAIEAACYAFVSGLDEVAGGLARLVESEPQRAAALYEAFVAGCQEKANEVDDSSGDQGTFVAGLFQGWIRARQAMHASPDETAARLLRWMDDDQFGFTLDLPADAARVLDRAGFAAAFAGQVRARFEARRAPAVAGGETTASWPIAPAPAPRWPGPPLSVAALFAASQRVAAGRQVRIQNAEP